MPKKDTKKTGRAGEYLASFIFEMSGEVEVHHVDRTDYDLICRVSDGQLVKVQVKAASCATTRTERHKTPTYAFYNKRDVSDVDYFCFVALDQMRMRLVRAQDVKVKYTTMRMEEFSDELQAADLAAFISAFSH
jgi:hypothetical protein